MRKSIARRIYTHKNHPVPKLTDSFLHQIVRRIISSFPQVKKIILFGSYAYGHPKRDSDLDLFIVMPTRKHWNERIRAFDSLFTHRTIPMDFVIRTPSETKNRLTSYFCPFTREIVQKGRILYEAPSRRS